MKNEDVESLNKMIESSDAIAKHLDAIIEAAQRQRIAVAETRAVLKLAGGFKEFEAKALLPPLPPGFTPVPIGIVIGGATLLFKATEILFDAGIKKVEENNRDIERWLEIQKKEMEALKKRYSKSEE